MLPDQWRSVEYAGRVTALREAAPALTLVVMVGEPSAGTLAWTEVASDRPLPDAHVSPAAVALLCYTSGTTADPKGVQLTHSAVVAEVDSQPKILGVGPDAVQLASFPLGHVAGLVSLVAPARTTPPLWCSTAWTPRAHLS